MDEYIINTSKLTCRAYLTIAYLEVTKSVGSSCLIVFDEVSKQLPNVSQGTLRSYNLESIVNHVLENRYVITHIIK